MLKRVNNRVQESYKEKFKIIQSVSVCKFNILYTFPCQLVSLSLKAWQHGNAVTCIVRDAYNVAYETNRVY